MNSPIHVFYDGTHIDLSQIVEIGPTRVTENVEYRAGSESSDLRMWFEVVFKDVANPRRYSYSLEDIFGGEAVRLEIQRQYSLRRLDSRNSNLARMEADRALLPEAREILTKHQNSLASAWTVFRTAPPAHEDPTIVRMLQALLDRQSKEAGA
jgi:hypothetical protein